MAEQQQRHKQPSNRSTTTKKKKNKIKTPFFPNSPISVGSPKDDGARFYPRSVRQRTPKQICSLVLPPPLISLFDNSAGAVDASTTSAGRLAAVSDNASLDGHSMMDNTNNASHTPTPVRYSSNASTVSASVVSVASVGGMGSVVGSSIHNNPHLPLHLRVGMAPCDPLLVFDGRFVLVGTCDGRIAIYSIVDFENSGGISEDVEASERRRRAEWKEEDNLMMRRQKMKEGDEKKDGSKTQSNDQNNPIENENDSSSDTQDEEHESDMRDRMHRREKGRQSVEPILIVSLPQNNHVSGDDKNKINNGSYDEESTYSVGNIANPPTIVAMSATPGSGTSLIEQRDVVDSSHSAMAEDESDTFPTGSQPLVPSFGKDLLGHVAVLVDDGQVHVLEFLFRAPTPTNELQENDAGCSGINEISTIPIPIVNFVLSFRTEHLGATCICMHPVLDNSSNSKGSQQQPLSTTESVHNEQQIRLCVGHQSGILATFQIYSECVYPVVKKVHSSPREDTETEPPTQTITRHHSHEKRTTYLAAASHTRSKSNDFQDIGRSNIKTSPVKASPRVLFQNAEATATKTNNLENVPFHRRLSEPIAVSSGEQKQLAPVVGPAKVVLCWQGKFDVPIRSVSSPGWGRPCKEEAPMEGALLVVGTEQRQSENANQEAMNGLFPSLPHHSLSPAISLEVINATLAEKYWCQIKKNGPGRSDGTSGSSSNGSNCISLYDCSVWPAAGKEIKDGWLRGALRRGVDPRDKLYGMLGLQRTSVTNKICCFEGPDSCFVSASSDGTVAISHYHPERGSWGVVEEDNQIMLFQRCIGIGTIDYGGNNPYKSDLDGTIPEARRYVVCCLRGGTIYLVPVEEHDISTSTQAMGQNDITMLAVPMDPDGDDDGIVRFVQNFTAGMAQVVCWKDQLGTDKTHLIGNTSDSSMKSVAMVGWPGGNIDVYEVTPGQRRDTDILIGEIVDRGVVTKLVERLLEIDRSHPLISSDLWCRVWDECHEVDNVDAILKGIKGTSRDFAAMRSLLLGLTREETIHPNR